MEIRLEGVEEVKKTLQVLGKDAPKVLKITINETAKKLRFRLTEEVAHVFDKPKPITKSAIRYTTIRESQNRLEANIYVDTSKGQNVWIWPHVHGTTRELKRSEQRLQRAGILPRGKMMRPGPDAKLDQYGNVSSGNMIKMLSQLRTFNEGGYTANQQGFSQYYYFADEHGIYRRKRFTSGRPEVSMVFIRQSRKYPKRFDFYGIGQKEGGKILIEKADETLDYALRNYK